MNFEGEDDAYYEHNEHNEHNEHTKLPIENAVENNKESDNDIQNNHEKASAQIEYKINEYSNQLSENSLPANDNYEENTNQLLQEHSQRAPSPTYPQQQNYNSSYSSKMVYPSVLWSGNGYHIYIPIKAIILDNYEQFSKDKFPNVFSSNGKYYGLSISEIFLKFVKCFFTNGKADPKHNPIYKSCLIRIPNTINSKCLKKGLNYEESKVKIFQKWNGYRPPIQRLTKDF
ncbi:MAG: hypothetical protein H0X03_09035, partial [Nitrosopumilus sp.]|nr:hypothetical protein [Nitrosopumilus sp.]